MEPLRRTQWHTEEQLRTAANHFADVRSLDPQSVAIVQVHE